MIVGAGLAGLMAAHAFPSLPIVEAMPEPTQMHKALLRFRSQAVGDLIGIEFRPVMVDKGIWVDGRFVNPDIRYVNLYARKVIGSLAARSIRHLESVKRYIAPPDLYERLLTSVGSRITWDTVADFTINKPIINTAPLPIVLQELRYMTGINFQRKPITVRRYRVKDADVFQTVYYPTPDHNLYRASITGSLLIAEFVGEPDKSIGWSNDMLRAFGLSRMDVVEKGTVSQKYGKIAEIDEGQRRAWLARLTRDHKIYSLGRFSTWRNILLDDVVHDIAVVRRLMKHDDYEHQLILAPLLSG